MRFTTTVREFGVGWVELAVTSRRCSSRDGVSLGAEEEDESERTIVSSFPPGISLEPNSVT